MSASEVLQRLKKLGVKSFGSAQSCPENFDILKRWQSELGQVQELIFQERRGTCGRVDYDFEGRRERSWFHVVGLLNGGEIVDLGSEPVVYDDINALLTHPKGVRLIEEKGKVDVLVNGEIVDLVKEDERFLLKGKSNRIF